MMVVAVQGAPTPPAMFSFIVEQCWTRRPATVVLAVVLFAVMTGAHYNHPHRPA